MNEETVLKEILPKFTVKGSPVKAEICNDGHINTTYKIETEADGKVFRYIVQKINTDIFKTPDLLMENIVGVTEFLKNKIISAGGDPMRETLTVIPTKDGDSFCRLDNGECWRVYVTVEGARAHQSVDRPGLFRNAAKSFGHFQMMLKDYPAATLHESIPNFHNTVSRMEDFKRAVAEDRAGRAASIADDIEFALAREEKCSFITGRIASGELPLRVTHNDTKLNNILIDDKTDEGICVIDLDTVMPGSVLYDFGDSIRFGASSAAEDETDLDKVFMRMDLFEEYLGGFVEGLEGSLTETEIKALPMGAYILTFETGIRFLGDYLNGDTYFKIHREGHNLDRARNQFKLVRSMEEQMDEMNAAVAKYL